MLIINRDSHPPTNNMSITLAVISMFVMLGVGSAFALNPPCPQCGGDAKDMAYQTILDELPISLWTDSETYRMGDTVTLSGHVANPVDGFAPTLQVRDATGTMVAIGQLELDKNGDFEILLATDSWTVTGVYQAVVQYGHTAKNNKIQFSLTEGMASEPAQDCGMSALNIMDECVPYEIDGGVIYGAQANPGDASIVVDIEATDDGMLHMDLPVSVIEDIFLVIVDGEEHNDVMVDGQSVKVWFMAGTEKIEILGARVIPEFGVVAVLVLAAAIVSIVAVSARSGLAIKF